MRKLITLGISIAMLIYHTPSLSQNPDTSQYYGKMDYVFENVSKIDITSGMLSDYGIEFLNLNNYRGTVLHDSNYVGLSEWRMLYTGLYSFQISNSNSILYLDTINRLIDRFEDHADPISFISLNYNYQRLRDDAITANLLTVNGERLYDVPGRPTHPFQTDELFAIAPIRQAVVTGSNQFIFRPELFLGNTGKTISNIAYDAAGGSNYQTVSLNTPFTITYNTAGFHDLNIRITYTDNSTRYCHTKILAHANIASRYGDGPVTTEIVNATKPYLGQTGQCQIIIDLAVNNTTGQIRKPLIVVEAFDPDGGFTYNEPFADDYVNRLTFDLNTGAFITLNDDLDDLNEYDLIFVNWQNGTDYIQRNAFVLEAVIARVNFLKTTWNGVRQDNVIMGLSMGGLVARYALRDMEVNSLAHETRLFISHDAPHWGANIPVGVQAAVQHLAPWRIINFRWDRFIYWSDMFPQAADALDLFNSPAARQMVIQRYTLTDETLTADNGTHNAFLSEINTLGWPSSCRTLLLSNGSCNGTRIFPNNSLMFTLEGNRSMTYFGAMWRSWVMTAFGGTANGFGLVFGWGNPQTSTFASLFQFPLSLFATSSSIGINFKIRAVPSSGTQELYRGDVFSKKKILWLINVTSYFIKCRVNSISGMLPLDNAPGGIYDMNEFGIDASVITSQLPQFFNNLSSTVVQPRFCFVPTVSSLAFTNPASFLNTPVCAGIACNTPAEVDDFFAPNVNELHTAYTQSNGDWIVQRQDPAFTCNKICPASITINGAGTVCTTPQNYVLVPAPPAGSDATWNATPAGIVTFTPAVGNSTTVTRQGEGQFLLSATYSNTCGNAVIRSQRFLQAGPFPVEIIGPYDPVQHTIMGVACVNEQYYFIASDPEGPSSYTWTFFPPPGSSSFPTLHSGSPVYYTFSELGAYTVRITKTNSCGTVVTDRVIVTQECIGFRITLTPNPVKDNLYVTLFDDQQAGSVKNKRENKTVRFELSQFTTGIRQRQWTNTNNSNSHILNVQGVTKGWHVLTVIKGKQRQSVKVLIQ